MVTRSAACSCGQLSLVLEGEPVRVSVCHCLACQRRTGSAFGFQARFARDRVRTSGSSREYVRISDQGDSRTFNFCPECGATVYYVAGSAPDVEAFWDNESAREARRPSLSRSPSEIVPLSD